MALRGTIKDFGLPDILQLIGIQRKTGILTLENDQDRVTVKFVDGALVAAETNKLELEHQLGQVLVRTGRITKAQLDEALETQKNTLQRLGYILVYSGLISDQELSEALQIQVNQIVCQLFRWRAGKYHFDPREDVDYDREHLTPIASETILMEGARMVDEWPIIERRIRSEKIVFKKTEAGEAIERPVESLVDEHVELDFGFVGGEAGAGESEKQQEITLSGDERDVLRIVDGRSTVQEIVDCSAIGEFDSYRALYELLTRNLIEEAKPPKAVGAGRRPGVLVRLARSAMTMVVLGLSLLAMLTLNNNSLTPWKLGADGETTDQLRNCASRVRLERLERAIRVFYLDTGAIPDQLELLAGNGYVDARDLLDPWGREYSYQFVEGGFQIVGLDPQGRPSEELTIRRRLSASQRMMLDGSALSR